MRLHQTSKSGRLIILALYVDDTMICFAAVDAVEWEQDKKAIAQVYPIKDMGECQWILNMKVTRDWERGTITLSQETYVDCIVAEFGLENAKAVLTPADPKNY